MPGLECSSGFDATIANICQLPAEVFCEACQEILSPLQGQSPAVDLPKICNSFQKAGIDLDWKALQSIVRLLSSNFRAAGKANLTADELVAKLRAAGGHWTRAPLEAVHQLWSDQGPHVHTYQKAHAAVSVAQLVDLQWRLGMAVSSDACRSLNSPYVSLKLKVAEPSGEVSYKSFEMSIQQFQNFHRQFKEMGAALETV